MPCSSEGEGGEKDVGGLDGCGMQARATGFSGTRGVEMKKVVRLFVCTRKFVAPLKSFSAAHLHRVS